MTEGGAQRQQTTSGLCKLKRSQTKLNKQCLQSSAPSSGRVRKNVLVGSTWKNNDHQLIFLERARCKVKSTKSNKTTSVYKTLHPPVVVHHVEEKVEKLVAETSLKPNPKP